MKQSIRPSKCASLRQKEKINSWEIRKFTRQQVEMRQYSSSLESVLPNADDLLCRDRRKSRLISVDRYENLQTNEWKCNKMLEDKTEDPCSN